MEIAIAGRIIIRIKQYFFNRDVLNLLRKLKIIISGPPIVIDPPIIRNKNNSAYELPPLKIAPINDRIIKYKPIRTQSVLPIQYNVI